MRQGYCYAAGMAQLEDGALYAAAPQEAEAGWGFVFKEDHEEMIMQDAAASVKICEVTRIASPETHTKG